MRTISLLGAIPKSFYSKELYQEVRNEWSGLGFGYLFVVICTFSLPIILFLILWASAITLDKPYDFNYIINQIPQLDIKNGEISTKAAMPYYIKEKETGRTVAIIDTTSPVTGWSQQMNEQHILAVIGKNQILLNKKPEKGEKTLYDIPQDTDMLVTGDVVRGWSEKFLSYSWVIILASAPFVILVWFLFRIAAVFLYAILSKMLSIILRIPVPYIDCVRISSVATTASLALFVLASIFSIELLFLTYFSVNAVYLFFAVRATKHDTF